MINTKKTTGQLFEELTEKMSVQDKEKLIILGDKLFAKGEKIEYKRIKRVVDNWTNIYCDEMKEEVEKHFENIHCLKCGKELLEEDSA